MERDAAASIVAEAVERGVNYFDVAPSYGNAQYVLGPALESHRKNVWLACKTEKRTAAQAQEELEESLRALKTDYFDLYQLHALCEPKEIEQVFAPGGAMEALVRAKEKGLIRHIGFTTHFDSSALEIMKNGDFDTMLFPVNFAYREQKAGSLSAVKTCQEKEMGVIAIKALAHRKWMDGEECLYPKCWYRPIYDNPELARLALNYTLSQNGVTTAVPPGDDRMFHLALDIIEKQGGRACPLTDEESSTLQKVAESVKDVIF
jgi:predicted aldo/keto reductase-like oxidoreductase